MSIISFVLKGSSDIGHHAIHTADDALKSNVVNILIEYADTFCCAPRSSSLLI